MTLKDIRQVVREDIIKEVKERLIKALKNFDELPEDRMEIINYVFPDYYYIIGNRESLEFLKRANDNIFSTLSLIKDYHEEYNGEVYIDLTNPEQVVTALVIMIAETILYEIEEYETDDVEKVIEQIKNV